MSETTPRSHDGAILSVRNVTKAFGRTQALADATLALRSGEVHALLGANGAGKSTLSRIVSGHLKPTTGEIDYDGRPLAGGSTRDALRSGIVLVAQETSLAPDLSVLENIFLPELGLPGRLSYGSMRDRAQAILSKLGHDHVLPLEAEVRRLSAAQRQLVEIAKALALDSQLIIFDEPTASLSTAEVDRLFDIMAKLRNDGKTLAFVSHRLEEVFAITDRTTILREGRTVAEDLPTADLTQADIIRHMVGRDIAAVHTQRTPRPAGEEQPVVFSVEGLRALPEVRDVSFTARQGEILGLGGLVGAGRSEAMEAIFGLRPRQAGRIELNDREVHWSKPADAIRAGMAMVAEDRRAQNIVPDLNVRENLYLAQMARHRGIGRGYGPRKARAAQLMERLGLPADRLETSLLNFSGGMQQKVIIARWLLIEPTVLILDEPTKGVDIGTRTAIYALLREVAETGVSIIVISSDFEELLGLCERVVVISDGITISDLPADTLTEESLTMLAAPRTSTERNAAVLRGLVEDYGGTAFWTLIDGDGLICLAVESPPGAPETGLLAGRAMSVDTSHIPAALTVPAEGFTPEPDGTHTTFLHRLANARGHDLGWIGLTLPSDATLPDPAVIAARIDALTNPETEEIAS